MRLEGTPFTNSPVCGGVGYAKDGAKMDIAKIELTGRYPERGWVMNETIYEMAFVYGGGGKFITGEGETVVATGDVISIEPGTCYAWEGVMTLITPCTPPFDPEQHKLVEEN